MLGYRTALRPGLAAAVLLLALTGCGAEREVKAGQAPTSTPTTQADAAADSEPTDRALTETDRKEIASAVQTWVDGSAGLCGRVTDRFLSGATGTTGDRGCQMLRQFRQNGGVGGPEGPIEVTSIEGAGARAHVTTETDGQPNIEFDLILDDGTWKLDD